MNPSKNLKTNSGWILCPSKTFPGKFYYFNVLNGEAAWSLSDEENNKLRREESNIHKITDKSHCYPEPDTPPIESPDQSSLHIDQNARKPEYMYRKLQLPYIQPQIPTFAQSFIPNIIWTPMPYQPPSQVYIPEVSIQTSNQVTQTIDDYDKVVAPKPTMPLCKRFVNFKNPVIMFDGKNKIVNKVVLKRHQFKSSTPVKSNQIKTSDNTFQFTVPNTPRSQSRQSTVTASKSKPIQNETRHIIPNPKAFEFKTKNTKCDVFHFQGSDEFESNKHTKSNPSIFDFHSLNMFQIQDSDIPNKQINSKPSKLQTPVPNSNPFQLHEFIPNSNSIKTNKQMLTSNPTINLDSKFDSEKISTLITSHKVENNITNKITTEKTSEDTTKGLESNDLRFILMARRQRLNQNIFKETKVIEKPSQAIINPVTHEKKISFEDSGVCENIAETESMAGMSNIHCDMVDEEFPSIIKPEIGYRTDKWYLVVETEILLEEYEFINGFIQSDEKCSLLVPYSVRTEIEAVSVGKYRSSPHVVAARRLSRQFSSPSHCTLQSITSPDDVTNSFTSILECCMDALRDNYRVVLITNDTRLRTKAESQNIECHNLEEFKNHNLTTTPKVYFPDKNKIMDLKKIKIIVSFVPKETERDSETNTPINGYTQQLFPNNRDLDCDKLINITKPKYQHVTKDIDNIQKSVMNSVVVNAKNNDRQNIVMDNHDLIPNSNTKGNFQKKNSILNFQTSASDEVFCFQKVNIPNSKSKGSFGGNININDISFKDRDHNGNLFNDDNLPEEYIPFDFYYETDLKAKDQIIPPSFQIQKDTKEIKINQPATKVSVDDKLKRFYVKSKYMDEKIRNRIEEWICCYLQVMEDFLNHILVNKSAKMDINLNPPWSLLEALQYIGIIYGEDKSINSIVHKLTELFRKYTTAKDKLNTNIKSIDFMKIVGCGILLVEALKTLNPVDIDISTSEILLNSLLQNIENQSDTDLDQNLLPPVVCRSEINHHTEERQNYIKDTSYIIDYLKKCYKNWENYQPTWEELNENFSQTNVVRTLGKNLNMLKIANNKSISLHKPETERKDGPIFEKHRSVLDKDGPIEKRGLFDKNSNKKITENNKLSELKTTKNIDSQIKEINGNHFDNNVNKTNKEIELNDEGVCLKGNTFGTNQNTSTKVIRKITAIEKYEKLLGMPIDLDSNNYHDYNLSESTSKDDFGNISCDSNNATDVTLTRIKNNEEFTDCDTVQLRIDDKNENIKRFDIKSDDNFKISDKKLSFSANDKFSDTNLVFSKDSACDSGFDNESTHIISLVKIFFTELSETFILVHGFINQFIKEIRTNLSNNRKLAINEKATASLEKMRLIIINLRSIIQRESHENTEMKSFLLKAGLDATGDKKMTRYRQVVTKCLEQAKILENALKMVVSITEDNFDDMTTKSESINSSIRYFNIFE